MPGIERGRAGLAVTIDPARPRDQSPWSRSSPKVGGRRPRSRRRPGRPRASPGCASRPRLWRQHRVGDAQPAGQVRHPRGPLAVVGRRGGLRHPPATSAPSGPSASCAPSRAARRRWRTLSPPRMPGSAAPPAVPQHRHGPRTGQLPQAAAACLASGDPAGALQASASSRGWPRQAAPCRSGTPIKRYEGRHSAASLAPDAVVHPRRSAARHSATRMPP